MKDIEGFTPEENELITSYLQHKMTAEEVISFEEYILDKPHMLERLELDAMLSNELPAAMRNESNLDVTKKTGVVDWLRSIWSSPLTTAGASFTIGALLVFSLITTTPIPESRFDLVEVSPVRSSSGTEIPDAVYTLNEKADHMILMLQPGHQALDDEWVQIIRRRDQVSLFNRQVSVNSGGEMLVSLPVVDFDPGDYDITIGNTEQQILTLRILKQ